MMRFIYLCMAVVAFSFVAIPAYNGISNARNEIGSRNAVIAEANENQSLSFEEIYEIASQDTPVIDENEEMANVAELLNDIVPAAGEESSVPALPEEFSAEFKPSEHPAF